MYDQPSTTPIASVSAADDYVIQLALDRGLVVASQVGAARATAAVQLDLAAPAPRLLDVLIEQGVLNARSVAELLAKEFGMQMAPDLANVRVTGDTLELVPRAVAARHRLILRHFTDARGLPVTYLCSANYCARYRPAARQFQELDLGTNHIGFRLAYPSSGTDVRRP